MDATTRLGFKQQVPVLNVLKYSGLGMGRHIKEFQSMLDCGAFGRQGVRPMDALKLCRKTLAVGGTRFKVCDTYLRKAWKGGLVPHDAKAVYEGCWRSFVGS